MKSQTRKLERFQFMDFDMKDSSILDRVKVAYSQKVFSLRSHHIKMEKIGPNLYPQLFNQKG